MAGDDEEPEIEVAAAPASAFQQKRRARTPNPVVDDQIATGEISAEPRSRIVRSSPNLPTFDMAKVQVREDPTEPVVPPPMPPRPMPMRAPVQGKKSRLVPLLVAGGLVLGAGIGALILAKGKKGETATRATATAPKADDHSASMQAAALFVGTTLDGDAQSTMLRAQAIASTPMLRAGIQTDARTLQDMAKDNDVAFPLKPGEVLDVYQIRDGQRVPMLRLPAGAPDIVTPAVGKTQLAISGGVLMVVVNTAIAPGPGGKLSGEIVLASPIDLEAIRRKVTMPSTIVGLATPIVVVGGAPGGNKQTVKIDTEMKAPISLEAVP